MQFSPLSLDGVWLVALEPRVDDRGFFARSWCQQEFASRGLNANLVQCNISFNIHPGTLRGLHYQIEPFAEAKLVRCTRGAIYDVVVDLRPTSATFLQWIAVELRSNQYQMLHIPEGLAHGFQTLTPETEVFYQMSTVYYPEAARGIRWNDPTFTIAWPLQNPILSDKDQSYPDFIPPKSL